MSYGDVSGGGQQPGMYVPPPPAARGRSPWLYVGLGCGLLVLLSFVGCLVAGKKIADGFSASAKQPFDAPKAVAALKTEGIPVYPGATVNEEMSKALRATFSVFEGFPGMSSMKFNSVAFTSPGTDEEIADWYDKKLPAAGWKASTAKSPYSGNGANVRIQHQYIKGTTQLLVQIGDAKGKNADADKRSLMLTEIKGIPAGK